MNYAKIGMHKLLITEFMLFDPSSLRGALFDFGSLKLIPHQISSFLVCGLRSFWPGCNAGSFFVEYPAAYSGVVVSSPSYRSESWEVCAPFTLLFISPF